MIQCENKRLFYHVFFLCAKDLLSLSHVQIYDNITKLFHYFQYFYANFDIFICNI